jgi:hypothetical protein
LEGDIVYHNTSCPVGTVWDKRLSPLKSEVSLHIRAVWPGPIQYAGIFLFILIFIKFIMDSFKVGSWKSLFKGTLCLRNGNLFLL